MPKYRQDDDQVSDGVNLLISILVRYPEIGTISFDPNNESLKLTFMLSGIPTQPEFLTTKKLILSSIAAYHQLEGLNIHITDVQLSTYENVAILNIFRDVATLSKSEIAMIIALLRDKFKDRLVADLNDSMLEEDLLIQEELIDNMLENIKKHHAAHCLIGIREDGRVLVFNK
ncbi:hypothetical protein [Dendrosporobacter sp. 1207_IL3150]|uniref:hypothetical protein n=1 Tax=Dendrosporobacter sp. 1207_IL3150 TaxID=3084054 RepID=UPI002FD8DC0C